MCACGYVHTCQCWQSRPKAWDSLELKLQESLSYPMRMPRTWLRSSARAVRALDCWAISPALLSPLCFFWGRVSCNPAGLKFIAILLSQPPKYWDSTCELPYPACSSNTLDLDPDLEKSPLISAQWWVIEGEISDGLLLNLLGHLSFVFQIKGNDSHVKQVPWRDWAEASSPLSSKLKCV